MASPTKTATWLIYDSTGATLRGHWPDAPAPRFIRSAAGITDMQVDLARLHGAAGLPGDLVSDDTVTAGNRVRVWVSDADALDEPARLLAIGEWVLGESAIGAPAGQSALVWQGTIEQVESAPPAGVRVQVLSLGRILEQSPVIGVYEARGDPLEIARDLLAEFCPGLAWDERNPATAGTGVVVTVRFANQSIARALDELAKLAGERWSVHVTPLGTVRMRDTGAAVDAGTVDHRLRVGYHVTDARLLQDNHARRKKVTVVYRYGRESAEAGDFDLADPRHELIVAEHLTESADALRLAELRLAAYDRLLVRGECFVPDGPAAGPGYDIEAIDVGDVVVLELERPSYGSRVLVVGDWVIGESVIGSAAEQGPLVVAQIDYEWTGARLHLSTPAADADRAVAQLERELSTQRAAP